MTIAQILTSGMPVQIELLTDLPDNVDPATWSRPAWFNYKVVTGIPIITVPSPSVVGTVSADFDVQLNETAIVRAFGIRYQGTGIFCGATSPFQINNGDKFGFTVTFFLSPWVQ